MMRRSCCLAVSLILAMIMAVTAGAAAKTKLVIWGQAEPNAALQPFLREYEKKHNIVIETIDIHPLGQREKLILDGPAGKGPDIFSTPHDGLGLMVLQGLVAPVTFSRSVQKEYIPVAIDALRYEGRIWGLPHSYNSVALVYNKDIFPKIPPTMEEFIAMAKKATGNGKYGLMWDLTNSYFDWAFIGGLGGYVFKQTSKGLDVNNIGLNNKGAKAAFKLFKDLRDCGMIPEGTDYAAANSLFTEGKLGAVVDGPWGIAGFSAAKLNYGVTTFPPFAGGANPRPFVTVGAYWVSAFSKNKSEAKKLVEFITSKEPSLAVYKSTKDIPPRWDIINDPIILKDPVAAAFAKQASLGMPTPNVPEMNAVWQPMLDALVAYLGNQAELDEVLDMCVEMIREGINEMHKSAKK